ncbi:MAG: YggS family pyridoxal phosphate-dependent enzyme [Elusimicrobia bacterium]|nr:YggS family pyridoxal phosphate-dependent enzyme [Elusimicrobiota bacterium]MBP9127595.1 YggS family pyridoxal phosphate-dependent enzyme [Elusimicrobiota bacterium]MBP9699170.1 YggS family pyridoxal phosphate-dependent enzyme [Elusimicrobiota bacterium]
MQNNKAATTFARALDSINERLAGAAQRAGRARDEVEILAVTKTLSTERMQEAMDLGIRQFGESRVQETVQKKKFLADLLPPEQVPRWHLIGHLQTNKVRRAVELFDCIQSVDSLRLAELLAQEGERRAQPVSCLIEIKISNEARKMGLPPDHLAPFLERAVRLSFLRIEGLMGIAPHFKNPEQTRPYFASLRSLFEKNIGAFSVARPILSMGMSQDFEVAVEEGSTMVRIGTALFGARA